MLFPFDEEERVELEERVEQTTKNPNTRLRTSLLYSFLIIPVADTIAHPRIFLEETHFLPYFVLLFFIFAWSSLADS
jgi:uncharacterized membrane protein